MFKCHFDEARLFQALQLALQRALRARPTSTPRPDASAWPLRAVDLPRTRERARAGALVQAAAGGPDRRAFTTPDVVRAVLREKPLIALLEPDPARGGLTVAQVREQLAVQPDGVTLADALFAESPIEWNRIGAFQDVTMRLIAERLLPESARSTTYLRGELVRLRPVLPRLPRLSVSRCCARTVDESMRGTDRHPLHSAL